MAYANQTCSSSIVGSPQNRVACASRAKIYSATYWIAIATYWLSVEIATGLIGVPEAIGQGLCKPALSVNDVEFSPINPATLARNWTAVVSVDASRCKANFRGTFEIVFTRLSKLPPIWNSESGSYGCRHRSMSAWSVAVMNRWSAIGLITSHRAFVGSNGEQLQSRKFELAMSPNGIVRPCSCPASDEFWQGAPKRRSTPYSRKSTLESPGRMSVLQCGNLGSRSDAMGHKRPRHGQSGMSAFTPKADISRPHHGVRP